MDISERINNIKPFFVSFNVIAEDDASYVLINVPKNWVIEPIIATFAEKYNVQTVAREEGIYFFTEIKNGAEPLFDCADELITYNKNIEARKVLLKEKINELTNIFATAPLEELKTLTFAMEHMETDEQEKQPDKPKKERKKSAKTPEEGIAEAVRDTVAEKAEEAPQKKAAAPVVEEENDDNSLMALAKGLTGE